MTKKTLAQVKATGIKQLGNAGKNFGHLSIEMHGFSPIREVYLLKATGETLNRLACYHEFGRPYAGLTASLLRDLADKIEQTDD